MNDDARRRIIRRPRVREITGLGDSSLYERMAAGTFPRPVPLGGRAVGWIESEVEEWIDARIAEREAAA